MRSARPARPCILSQKHEAGLGCRARSYDDGGFSGGNMSGRGCSV